MKKSLGDTKKLLAKKSSAAEVLQKSLAKTKAENAGILKKIAELEPVVEPEVEAAAANSRLQVC